MDYKDLDHSAHIKLTQFYVVGIFYGSVVSHSRTEKQDLVKTNKQKTINI